jgi:hypothetical protein
MSPADRSADAAEQWIRDFADLVIIGAATSWTSVT